MTWLRTIVVFLCIAVALCAGGFLSGCAAVYPTKSSTASYGAVGTSAGTLNHALPPPAQGDELWIIEKPADDAVPTIDIPGSGEVPVGGGILLDTHQPHFSSLKLEQSDISAQIDGAIASVDIRQRFINPSDNAIEAAYAFPLPRNASVNEFVITIGSRHIRGIVREAAEARKIYDEARSMGFLSSLIVQKSPGVFLQRIANLAPGRAIDVEMRYIQTVYFNEGAFTFVCPMCQRPTDGSAVPATRSGRDVSLAVQLNAGIDIDRIESPSHEIAVTSQSASKAHIALSTGDAIANTDFVLRYKPSPGNLQSSLTIERDGADGTFALLAISPEDPTHRNVAGLAIDWHGANVTDVFPKPEVLMQTGHPILLIGRYHGSPPSIVTVGDVSSAARTSELRGRQPLASLWAFRQIAELTRNNDAGADPKSAEQARHVAMEFGVESSFTSFVVVDAMNRR